MGSAKLLIWPKSSKDSPSQKSGSSLDESTGRGGAPPSGLSPKARASVPNRPRAASALGFGDALWSALAAHAAGPRGFAASCFPIITDIKCTDQDACDPLVTVRSARKRNQTTGTASRSKIDLPVTTQRRICPTSSLGTLSSSLSLRNTMLSMSGASHWVLPNSSPSSVTPSTSTSTSFPCMPLAHSSPMPCWREINSSLLACRSSSSNCSSYSAAGVPSSSE
mmetsp:Transcript_2728/g.8171  ORF Transcript_2728/g.8171 Transcript_2728/m.8171 type:complete len:223 (-) Transcript_2728:718-1386(-)